MEAHLSRQEALVARLEALLSAPPPVKGAAAAAGAAIPALLRLPENDFTVPHSDRAPVASCEALCDELVALPAAAHRRDRDHRVEPPVDDAERAEPPTEWVAPTAAEAAEMLEVRPWLAVIAPPSHFEYNGAVDDGATRADDKPRVALELEHVFGVRSSGVRGCVRVVGPSIVFPVGALAVVQEPRLGAKQTFFRGHNDDVVSLAVGPDGLVATGDQGRFPAICVWKAATGEQVARLSGNHRRAVVALAFAEQQGVSLLASVGLDDAHTVAVHDWARGRLLGSARGGNEQGNRILQIAGNVEAQSQGSGFAFISVGEQHICFWSVIVPSSATSGGTLSRNVSNVGGLPATRGPATGSFSGSPRAALTCTRAELGRFGDRQPFLCVASTPQFNAVGTQAGEVYLLQGTRLVRVIDCHHSPVLALAFDAKRGALVTGGQDGVVCAWDAASGSFRRVGDAVPFRADHDKATQRFRPNSVRSLDVDPASGDIVVAGAAGTIDVIVAGAAGAAAAAAEVRSVMVAHRGDLRSADAFGELCGLAVHPTDANRFASVCEQQLYVWDASTRQRAAATQLPSRGVCAAFSPDGALLAVGLQNGQFTVLDGATLREVFTGRASVGRRVQCVRFSPDGTVLAVGSADNAVDIYDASRAGTRPPSFAHGGRLTGCRGVVLNIDFSVDGRYIQSATQAFELAVFDLHTMKMLTDAAEQRERMRDVAWATATSVLGWATQGIWPQGSELNDVNAVCRGGAGGRLLATAEENGLIKLFHYPCVGGGLDREAALRKRPDAVRAAGHSERVTQVQWLAGDARIVSTGGRDLGCFVWRVVPTPAAAVASS